MELKEITFQEIIIESIVLCIHLRHEYVTPEHTLSVLLDTSAFHEALVKHHSNIESIYYYLDNHFSIADVIIDKKDYTPLQSLQFQEMLKNASLIAEESSDTPMIDSKIYKIALLMSLFNLEKSYASHILTEEIGGESEIENFIKTYSLCLASHDDVSDSLNTGSSEFSSSPIPDKNITEISSGVLREMNTIAVDRPPLIGRTEELNSTIEILCRMERNNPLHIGEPGVGKTALVWGLVRKILDGEVPERLKNSKVFMLDIGSLLASSQYRGELEKTLKESMNQLESLSNPIVYIDDIHTLIGAGRSGESALDATDLLKPYMEEGKIRFIGSTTYDDYKRYLERNRRLLRLFQTIEISEPSIEESIRILIKLKGLYESYHQVHYPDSSIRHAVECSAKYISTRHLPAKALDILDAAGARLELHPTSSMIVSKSLLTQIVSEVSKISNIKDDKSSELLLETLDKRILKRIYGQDLAVRTIVESIQMSKAGLSDESKPLSSLLFVGPTGVGKTELAKVLSEELGIELLRFDMSEYTEKHTVAKLIGSPSGYVGYDDGGLLTDAIRRTPNCVLLLDEIEKAHSDIYNLLLQVMDYAKLTDNKGKKADFRNVVLIMTSNAGAQYASQASVGFSGGVSRGEAMSKQVKRIFKPEFINRLSSIVTFNDMDEHMASQILKKKLRELERKLSSRQVRIHIPKSVFDYLLKLGYSKEYGAREMDRVINSELKPVLMREILFGKLRNGGEAKLSKSRDGIQIR